MKVTKFTIPCIDYEIAASWYEGKDSSRALLVLHGWSSSRARQNDYIEAIIEHTGTPVLAIDLSGHGESPFELRNTRPAQHLLELVAAYDWLTEQYQQMQISISGSSYGGFLAAHLVQYRKIHNLILRAPAIYPPHKFYEPWSVRIDNPKEFDHSVAYRHDIEALAAHPLLTAVRSFSGRALVVAHGEDTIVPEETTAAYTKALAADSFTAEGIEHAVKPETLPPEVLHTYQEKIAQWLKNKQ